MKQLASFLATALATSALVSAADDSKDQPKSARSATLAAPATAGADNYKDRLQSAGKAAREAGSKEGYIAELEKQGRALIKDFPDKEEPYQMLLHVAENSEGDKAQALLKELDDDKTPTKVRDRAKVVAKKLNMVGKPLELKFKAVDGRDVDVAALKGKVVLVDFWATWCGPCVAELPNVKAAYDKLHPKGFEIVGISFDKDQEKLEEFVKTKDMAWPQYFDGKVWENDFGRQFGIQSIPSMWLVDKKGNLVDVSARGALAEKVEKLLAE
jgi:thiol-disulfide isomerase/thioredoxin